MGSLLKHVEQLESFRVTQKGCVWTMGHGFKENVDTDNYAPLR